MDNRKTALFGAVIAVAAGLFGANAAQINNSQSAITNSLAEGSPVYGHITVEAKDKSGHVYAYRQSDNMIVNQGLNCMGVALFRVVGTQTDRNACGGTGSFGTVANAFSTVSGFRWIEIGTSSVVPDQSQNGLQGALTDTQGIGSTVPTLTEFGATTGGTGATGATGTGPSVVVSVAGLAPAASLTINEAGLFDGGQTGTSTPNMFARQTFASITMGSADTLSVTWTITLAHS